MLGATLAGAGTPTAALSAALAARYGAADTAQLIGRGQRANTLFAALANGMTCHALELDDGHRYAVGLHSAPTTIPAALACAEEAATDVETLLAALVLGYEVAGRVGTAVNPAHRRQGFPSTARLACSARPLLRLTCVASRPTSLPVRWASPRPRAGSSSSSATAPPASSSTAVTRRWPVCLPPISRRAA